MSGIVQVAGVIDRAEAELLVACGVDLLGFPFRLPVHQEDLSEAEAARIVADLPDPVGAVLITYLDDAMEVAALARELGVGWVQLHGPVSVATLDALRQRAPGLRIVKSLIVRDGETGPLAESVREFASRVDAFITDSFDPSTGATGATGQPHDLAVDHQLVVGSPRPVIMAGGLTPDTVGAAIRRVRPAGVDVHTGVEGADGRKCRDRVTRFVKEARAAFAEEEPWRPPIRVC